MLIWSCSDERTNAAAPAAAPQAQLDALAQSLESYLILNGKPPQTLAQLVAFHNLEQQLDPQSPKIDASAWRYQASLAPDAGGDPTDPGAKGVAWRCYRMLPYSLPGWPGSLAQRACYDRRWTSQARGLVIRLDSKSDPALQLVKWLPLKEQVSLAAKATSETMIRLLDAWGDNLTCAPAGVPAVTAILPALGEALRDKVPNVRLAAFRCASRILLWGVQVGARSTGARPMLSLLELLGKAAPNARTSEERALLVNALGYLTEGSEQLATWAQDPDPAVRAAALDLFIVRDYFFKDPPPEVFRRLRQDDSPVVKLAMARFIAKRLTLLAGSSGFEYIDRGQSGLLVLEILNGSNAAARLEFLKALDGKDLSYLTMFDGAASRQAIMDRMNALTRSPDLNERREAWRIMTGTGHLFPKNAADFALLEPLIRSGKVEDARVAGEVLAASINMQSDRAARAMMLKAFSTLDGEPLVAFCGFDFERQADHLTQLYLKPGEGLPLFEKWVSSRHPLVRQAMIFQLHGLIVRADKKRAAPSDYSLTETQRKTIDALQNRLLNDEAPQVRLRAAVSMLGEQPERLLAWVQRQPDPLRRDATLMLGGAKRPWLRPELLRVLKQGDLPRRWEAAQLLADTGEPAQARAFWATLGPRAETLFSFCDFAALNSAMREYNNDCGGSGAIDLHAFAPPRPYLPAMPSDPFRADGGREYRLMGQEGGILRVLYGVGPDGKPTPELAQVETMFKTQRNLTPDSLSSLSAYCYDPTNGVLSGGDFLATYP